MTVVRASVNRPIGEVDGIAVDLVELEVRRDRVVVRLDGVRSTLTDRLDIEFIEAFEAWIPVSRAARKRGERGPDPPDEPGARLMELAVALSDDAGTEYRLRGHQAGGTGTEWVSKWNFTPGPPDEASHLTVSVGGPSGGSHVVPIR